MLTFTSLTIENFGPYKGTQTIDFSNGKGVTLIWGNNGRGKTTLLNLFRYALFGRFQNRHTTVQDISMLANIEGHNEGNYNFKVVLRMQNDGKAYELTRQYEVRTGITIPTKNDDYEPSVFLKIDGSILSKSQAEHELATIIPEDVSRFFLFDGELLQEYEELMQDETATGEKIKKSIETILGLPVLTNGELDAEAILKDYRSYQTDIAKRDTKTQKYAAQMAVHTATLDEQTKELKRLEEELEQQYITLDKLQEEGKNNEHVRELIKIMERLEGEIEEKKVKREDILQRIVAETKDLWKCLISQKADSMLSALQPELKELESKQIAQRTLSQLIEQMEKAADQGHCDCCDQEVDTEHADAIRRRVQEWADNKRGLSPKDDQRLSKLRIQASVLSTMHTDNKKATLEFLEENLKNLTIEIEAAEKQLKNTIKELERYGNAGDLKSKETANARDITTCRMKIGNLEQGIIDTKEQIRKANSAIATLADQIKKTSTSDMELQLASRKMELCEDLYHIFEEGISAYRDKLKQEVERDATTLFRSIASDKDYTALRINDNYGLAMVHKSGQVVPLRSAGYEHIVALSLIGALHKNAPLNGPIIMDSPFGRLDSDHKAQITRALPQMADQIILLAYTDEIDRQIAREALGSTLQKEYVLTRYSSFHTEIEEY